MFLPNSHSFVLEKSVKPIVEFGLQKSAKSGSRLQTIIPISVSEPPLSDTERKIFLPNSNSFLLTRSVKTVIQSDVRETVTSLPSFTPSNSGNKGKKGKKGKKIFLPNSNSFSLTRSVKTVIQSDTQEIVTSLPSFVPSNPEKKGKKIFLPNSNSFSLAKTIRPITESDNQEFIATDIEESSTSLSSPSSPDSDKSGTVDKVDKNKRSFLKVAGIAGAGLVGSLLLPEKADALIMGSSPTTGVVGVKDSTNTRINPATEETLNEVLKTSDLSFDAGALEVKVTSVSGAGSSSFSDSLGDAKSALVDGDRHVQVDVLSSALPTSASTETTLQTISFGGFKFSLRLATVGSVDYIGEAAIGSATSSAVWRVKKIDSTTGITITWAGTGVFDQVWDNYLTLTYS